MQLFQGDYPAALQEYQTAAAGALDDETRIASQIGVAQAYYTAGDCESASATIAALLVNDADNPLTANAYYFLGECYETDGAYVQAADAFATYVNHRPGVLDQYMRTRQGLALAASGDYMGAITAYQQAIEAAQGGDTERLQVRIARAYAALGDYVNAVRLYMTVYDATTNDYTKAEMDLLSGQAYEALAMPEQAYARYQDAVYNFPRSYDSYASLVALVNANQPVDEFTRGLVDYYAQQYGVAAEAFIRYLDTTPTHDGAAHYYLALSYQALGQHDNAIATWQKLIRDHPDDRYWSNAWYDIAEAQWYFLDDFKSAAQTLLDYVARTPAAEDAPEFLFTAGRIMERDERLTDAAATWERIINEYPNAENAYQALFMAGILHYRLENYPQAQTVFQRNLVLAADEYDSAMASFWVGKALQAQGDAAGAQAAWQKAAAADPTSYYSERAGEVLAGLPPFTGPQVYDLAYNLERERVKAEEWMRTTFTLPPETNFSGLGDLVFDARMVRGTAFWELGLYNEARSEFENLRLAYEADVVATYRLTNHFHEIGLYRSAILAARQVLDLANLSDADTMQAPIFFNHIRFGTYYRDLVVSAAQAEGLHPLFLFSVIRQESFFEGFAQSSMGARGLMQIMPATGAEIAEGMNWPYGYTVDDLYRPAISIPMGARYLVRMRDYLDGSPFGALAAYNGGSFYAAAWMELANGDPDLFVEVIRFSETESYIRRIYENFKIYSNLYSRTP